MAGDGDGTTRFGDGIGTARFGGPLLRSEADGERRGGGPIPARGADEDGDEIVSGAVVTAAGEVSGDSSGGAASIEPVAPIPSNVIK